MMVTTEKLSMKILFKRQMVSQFQELFVYVCLLQIYLGRWYLFIALEKLVFAFLFTNPYSK